jgi:hypothetical protein
MTLSVLDDGVILGGYCPGTVRPSWNPLKPSVQVALPCTAVQLELRRPKR